MSDDRPSAPARVVPTLTEVVELDVVDLSDAAVAAAPHDDTEPGLPAPQGDALLDETRIVEDVLASLQQRVDLMFEYRLREAVAPVLARTIDQMINEMRDTLAGTLRDVVVRAVAQEVARRRQPR